MRSLRTGRLPRLGLKPGNLVLTPGGVRFRGRVFPCSIGRGGLSDAKREGDGATPCGTHGIIGCLYRPDRVARPNGWAAPIRPRDCWSDDPAAPDYNCPVQAPYAASHEILHRADPLYDIVLLTDWNWPCAVPEYGSAIFLHQWRKPRHPTAGCIALRRDHLRWITERLAPGARLVVR